MLLFAHKCRYKISFYILAFVLALLFGSKLHALQSMQKLANQGKSHHEIATITLILEETLVPPVSHRPIQSAAPLKPVMSAPFAIDAGKPQTLAIWQGPNLMPKMQRPAYLQPFIDPVYQSTITRITDESQGGYNNNPAMLRHNYPNDQVWNADMSLIKLNFGQIRDAHSYEFVRNISKNTKTKKSYDQILWSNVDADILYGLYENTFNRYSLATGEWSVLHTFKGYGKLTTNYMSSLSTDDRYIALHDDERVLVYDLVEDKITGTMPMGDEEVTASMSQSGKYVLVTSNKGFFAYNQQLKRVRKLSNKSNHDDFGYDAAGNEVVIQMCPARMVQIDNGKKTDLLGLSYVCGHVSARNYKKPGWAYISSVEDTNDDHYGAHISTEVMEVKLDDSGIVNTLAHSRTTYQRYEANALVGVSPDGSKIIFHSDWGDNKGRVYAYVIHNKQKKFLAQTTLHGRVNPVYFLSNTSPQITWYTLSGKGKVVFANKHALETNVTFSEKGRYILQMRVSNNNDHQHTDHVIIDVGKI